MLHLLLSASLLTGIGTSQRTGEVSPFSIVKADARYRDMSLEAGWDSADKVENGSGWAIRGAVDAHVEFLTVGTAYSYRHTHTWSKDVWWARAGATFGPLWLLASLALGSPNEERRLEL